MYNTEFQEQLDASRERLFGDRHADPRTASDEAFRHHSPLRNGKTIPCHENANGEWIPDTDQS